VTQKKQQYLIVWFLSFNTAGLFKMIETILFCLYCIYYVKDAVYVTTALI